MSILYETLRSGVHDDWDPIGIRAFTDELGEYDAYVPRICQLLSSGARESEAFDYLWKVETGSMGLTGHRHATAQFAKWLCGLKGLP